MNRQKLAYHLHRWIRAQQGKEPPTEPTVATSETVDTGAEEHSDDEPASPPNHSTTATDTKSPGNGETGDDADMDSSEGDALDNPEARQEKLDSLEQQAGGCVKCDLSENRNMVVFGEGNVEARVMVIGEGPGAREDEQGRPFVGPAGELLRGGFEKVGLSTDDVYITNTVKCRPPGNRNPKPEELDACRPYLDRQLELIDPEVILTLGNFALQYCLGEERRISRSRGEVYDWEGYALVPTYHPAYILRNRSDAKQLFSDFKRVVNQLHG